MGTVEVRVRVGERREGPREPHVGTVAAPSFAEIFAQQSARLVKRAALRPANKERLFDGLTMLGFILTAATVVSLTSQLRHIAIIAFVLFAGVLIGLFLLVIGIFDYAYQTLSVAGAVLIGAVMISMPAPK